MNVPPPEQKDEEVTCQPCGEEWGARPVQIKRGPKEPTEDERKKHDACHVPFRSWCSHCVMAAAKASPHRRDSEDEEDAVPPGNVPDRGQARLGHVHPRVHDVDPPAAANTPHTSAQLAFESKGSAV